MLDIGAEAIYLPLNWVNNQDKVNHRLYGKKAVIKSCRHSQSNIEPVYFIEFENKEVMYAYYKELEICKGE